MEIVKNYFSNLVPLLLIIALFHLIFGWNYTFSEICIYFFFGVTIDVIITLYKNRKKENENNN
jgi:hypothetical protein